MDLLAALGIGYAVRRKSASVRHGRALVDRHGRVTETMWRSAAAALGAQAIEIAPRVLEFRLGDSVTRVRGQATPFADPVSQEVAGNKLLAHRLLAHAGVEVPEHASFGSRDLDGTAAFVLAADAACVVKPLRGAGGDGVTGEVRTRDQVRRALNAAGRLCPQVLLERQVEGDSYRLLVLQGEVLDVLRRPRPRVVGDGRSTIEQLISRECEARINAAGPAGLKPLMVDLDCLFNLERAGKRLQSVPAAGESVVIKTATNYNGPRETTVVPEPWPEPFVDAACRSAAALGVRLGGVDVVAPSAASVSGVVPCVVLEVNAVPALTHHYNVAAAGVGEPVATRVLRELLAAPRPTR
jgi:cyanophycin synthetase